MMEGEMQIDTEETLVPNWFDKDHVESLLDKKLSTKQWEDFKSFCEDTLREAVGDLVKDQWDYFEDNIHEVEDDI